MLWRENECQDCFEKLDYILSFRSWKEIVKILKVVERLDDKCSDSVLQFTCEQFFIAAQFITFFTTVDIGCISSGVDSAPTGQALALYWSNEQLVTVTGRECTELQLIYNSCLVYLHTRQKNEKGGYFGMNKARQYLWVVLEHDIGVAAGGEKTKRRVEQIVILKNRWRECCRIMPQK